MFAIENTNDAQSAIVSINIANEDYNPGDIKLNQKYVNTINHGNEVQYELNTYVNPDMAYLKSLKIKLNSIIGDADLYVSFTNPNPDHDDYDFASRT